MGLKVSPWCSTKFVKKYNHGELYYDKTYLLVCCVDLGHDQYMLLCVFWCCIYVFHHSNQLKKCIFDMFRYYEKFKQTKNCIFEEMVYRWMNKNVYVGRYDSPSSLNHKVHPYGTPRYQWPYYLFPGAGKPEKSSESNSMYDFDVANHTYTTIGCYWEVSKATCHAWKKIPWWNFPTHMTLI